MKLMVISYKDYILLIYSNEFIHSYYINPLLGKQATLSVAIGSGLVRNILPSLTYYTLFS